MIGVRAACRATGPGAGVALPAASADPRAGPAGPGTAAAATGAGRGRAGRGAGVAEQPGFCGQGPGHRLHELLDEGVYVASVSSMYRILRAFGEVHERRRQAVHPARVKPELVATGPNQCWSWDITKLHGPVKWSYFHLYVIIDIYSRYTVGWLIAARESAELAEQLLADTIAKHGIDPDTLTIHADNGSSMASKPVAFLLADLV